MRIQADNVLNARTFFSNRQSHPTTANRSLKNQTYYRTSPNSHFHKISGVPINHNEHKIRSNPLWSLPYLKQSKIPVEGPNIIYEVLAASTALQRGIDPLGKAFS